MDKLQNDAIIQIPSQLCHSIHQHAQLFAGLSVLVGIIILLVVLGKEVPLSEEGIPMLGMFLYIITWISSFIFYLRCMFFKMGFPRKSNEFCISCCASVCKFL